jgi:general secretion pathway protein G
MGDVYMSITNNNASKIASKTANKNFKKGFTLIELICVLAIIGALVAMLMPMKNQALAKFSDTKLKTTLVTVDSAIQTYKLENDEFPESLDDLKGDYLPNKDYKDTTGNKLAYTKNSDGSYTLTGINTNGDKINSNGDKVVEDDGNNDSSNS